MWDIDSSTTGRALIVPSAPITTDLGHAAFEWQTIMESLSKGQTVSQAVQAANDYALHNNFRERYTIIGDGNVRTKKP